MRPVAPDSLDPDGDTRTVHRDRDFSHPLSGESDCGIDRRLFSYVGFDKMPADLFRHSAAARRVPVEHRNLRALLGKMARRGLSQTGGRARDDR